MLPTLAPESATVDTPKPMLGKILVALDYLEENPEIFHQALEIAEKFQAELRIFHCVEPQPVAMPEIGALAAYGGMIDATAIALQEQQFATHLNTISAWLQRLAKQATDRHITINVEYHVGEPQKEICAIATSWAADLIIIGRRGLKGISEVLLGSISSYVLHHAPCSVMVIQHTPPHA